MIHILDWNYITDGSILDNLRSHDWESLRLMADSLGIKMSKLNREIKKLKEDGKLVTYRYSNNNFIWCIGEDVDNLLNHHDAIATARYRRYIECGGNENDFFGVNGEEQENILIDIPIFESEKKNLAVDNGYEYLRRTNHLRRVTGVYVDKKLHNEVENMWKDI